MKTNTSGGGAARGSVTHRLKRRANTILSPLTSPPPCSASIADAILPDDFFRIRVNSPPRASYTIMRVVAALIYVIVCGSFVTLFVYVSNTKTQETKISTEDKSGSGEGWSCEMLTKVSHPFTHTHRAQHSAPHRCRCEGDDGVSAEL
jgi:hypothetical protein